MKGVRRKRLKNDGLIGEVVVDERWLGGGDWKKIRDVKEAQFGSSRSRGRSK